MLKYKLRLITITIKYLAYYAVEYSSAVVLNIRIWYIALNLSPNILYDRYEFCSGMVEPNPS